MIEALGNYQADIAWLPTFAYVLAKEKHDVEVKFMTVRDSLKMYRGQFIARQTVVSKVSKICRAR